MGMGCAGSLRGAAARHEPPEVGGDGVINLWVVAASSLEIRIAGSACGSEPKVEETKKQKTETTGERERESTGETITEQTAEATIEENLESRIGEVEDVPELTPSEPPQPLPVELAEPLPAPVEQMPEEVIEEENPAA